MEIQENLKLISTHKDMLKILRQQQAGFGTMYPPHIIFEINRISQTIKDLENANLEIIDKMYYNLEKQTGYVCHLTNQNSLTYNIRIPLQDQGKSIEIVEIKNIYTHELNLLNIQTILEEIEFENVILYEVFLNINTILIFGKLALSGNKIFYQLLHSNYLNRQRKRPYISFESCPWNKDSSKKDNPVT
jgi:hypothetical protein